MLRAVRLQIRRMFIKVFVNIKSINIATANKTCVCTPELLNVTDQVNSKVYI